MRARQRRPQRLRDGAEADVFAVGEGTHDAFQSRLVPRREVPQGGREAGETGLRLVAEQLCRLGCHRQRPFADQKRQLVGKLDEGLRSRLRLRQQGRDAPASFVRGGRRVARGEPALDLAEQRGLVARPDVVAVEAPQLLHVEARGSAVHRVEVEPGDGLGGVDDLVVAVAPAEPQQRIAHRRRQNAELRIGADGDGAVPLGKLGAVGPVDQRYVGVGRRLPAEGAEELGLAKGVGEVVVPPGSRG